MAGVESGLQQEISALYSDHHGWLQGWLRRRLGCIERAADIAHDTYVRVLSTGRTPPSSESRRYLRRIATGLAIDAYRRRRIELAYLDTIAGLPGPEVPSEEARALIVESLIELSRMLEQLPDKARVAFLLCKLEGRSYREIAERLNVSMSSVEKYIATALCMLCNAHA